MRYIALTSVIALIQSSSCTIIPRQPTPSGIAQAASGQFEAGNTPWQSVPSTQQNPDNSFNVGTTQLTTEPPNSADTGPAVYGARPIDIPFRRLHQGNLVYFKEGQLNTPSENIDKWAPGQNDHANQSACGIPDNAYFISKVAIHPYFLKYSPDNLGLNRYCMQDVCINFVREDWTNDMILKVTDVCCTDPNDPSCCATPNDIKIDRTKAQILYGFAGQDPQKVPELSGSKYPQPAYWFFSKCWDDALVQPAYAQNWWSQPPMPNNENGWQGRVDTQQHQNNQASYPAKGWKTYPMGGYMDHRVFNISDWRTGEATLPWSPVAGGKGWGDEAPAGKTTGYGKKSTGHKHVH